MNVKNRFTDPAVRERLRVRLAANGARLSDRQIEVVALRAGLVDGHHHSNDDVGRRLGVTANRVRQIEKQALEVLETGPDLGPASGDTLPAFVRAALCGHADDAAAGHDRVDRGAGIVALPHPAGTLTVDRARAELLAAPTRSGDTLRQLLASWLATVESAHTRAAYLRDVSQYLDYCVEHALDPLTVRIPQFNMFTVWLRVHERDDGRRYAATTRSRKISAVSSFYSHLVDTEAVDRSPVTGGARPAFSRNVPEKVLTVAETVALIESAAAVADRVDLDPRCAPLVVELLFTMGLRVSEVCGLDTDHLSWIDHDGRRYRAVTFIGKGDKEHVRGVPDVLDWARLTPYVEQRPRPAGLEHAPALLLTLDGRRLDRHRIGRLLLHAARHAGIGRRVSAHWGRHTFNRRAEEAGIPIEARQRALGHASVVTTQGYGQSRNDVVRDPSHVIASLVRHPADAPVPDPRGTSDELRPRTA